MAALCALAALIEDLEDEEDETRPGGPSRPLEREEFEYSHVRFSLEHYSNAWILEFLVFSRSEIKVLVELFDLEAVEVQKRYRHDPEMGLCLVLRRLSFPVRLKDLQDLFGLHRPSLSVIFNDTITYLDRRYRELLRWYPTKQRIYEYADCLAQFGTAGCIWGWIDGTFKSFSRPEQDQRAWYSGYKKAHGQKWQAVIAPDGLIVALDGPYHGSTNDILMLHRSEVQERLSELLRDDRKVVLYGDEAYQLATYVMALFPGGKQLRSIDPVKAQFNTAMSSLRMSVEHGFGIDQGMWTANAFKIGAQAGLMPVSAFVKVSFLLTNCHTCL